MFRRQPLRALAALVIATMIELSVDPLPQASPGRGTGLTAEYWPNADFTGTPAVRRVEPGVNHNWKFTGSPDAKIPAEGFSSRWTGQVVRRDTGKYTFTTVSDDTVRLWVDGKLLGSRTRSGSNRPNEAARRR
jgi:alpha-L-fucosidase